MGGLTVGSRPELMDFSNGQNKKWTFVKDLGGGRGKEV